MIFDLDDITVAQFTQLDDQQTDGYMRLYEMMNEQSKKAGITSDLFQNHKAKELGTLTFGEVSNIKAGITNQSDESITEVFSIIYGVNPVKIMTAKVTDYFQAVIHVGNKLNKLIENERKVLANDEIDADLELAGAAKLSVFEDFGTLITLGEQFSCTPMDIESWKYNTVFSILAFNKIKGDIQKRYQELKSKPNGH